MSRSVLHKHHIVPKHAGGTDDPSNIIELTIEDHAEAHRILFEQYARWQDYLAWKALSGQLSTAEITQYARKHRDTAYMRTEEYRKSVSDAKKGKPTWNKGITGYTLSESHKKSISNSLIGNTRRAKPKKPKEYMLWKIKNPSHSTLIIRDLKQFCVINHLNYNSLKNRRKWNGWVCVRFKGQVP
jgi:hypothetical protein